MLPSKEPVSGLESWVMLSTLDVLDAVTTIVCYCNKIRTLACARNENSLFSTDYD
jgi:hypothetical protein